MAHHGLVPPASKPAPPHADPPDLWFPQQAAQSIPRLLNEPAPDLPTPAQLNESSFGQSTRLNPRVPTSSQPDRIPHSVVLLQPPDEAFGSLTEPQGPASCAEQPVTEPAVSTGLTQSASQVTEHLDETQEEAPSSTARRNGRRGIKRLIEEAPTSPSDKAPASSSISSGQAQLSRKRQHIS